MQKYGYLIAAAILSLICFSATSSAQVVSYACVNANKTRGWLVSDPGQCNAPNHLVRITQAHRNQMSVVPGGSGGGLKARSRVIRCVTVCDKWVCVRYCCAGLDDCWIQTAGSRRAVY